MRSYSIYDAKAKLSELIRVVCQFGPVVITDRGVPIVQVSKIETTERSLESRLNDLEKAGLLIPAKTSLKKLKPLAKRPGALKRFLESRD